MLQMSGRIELATFGMGCFWCSQASFSGIEGVVSTQVGYMGGTKDSPTYGEVSGGRTGHIEVVQVRFDERITYQGLLEIFWGSHDPTFSGEGDDGSGQQYRSSVFYHDQVQKVLAEGSMRRFQASGRFRGRLTTLIVPASTFWMAEEHHQCYIAKMQNKRHA